MPHFRSLICRLLGPCIPDNPAKRPDMRFGLRLAGGGVLAGAVLSLGVTSSAVAQTAGGSLRATARVARFESGAANLDRGKALVSGWARAGGLPVRITVGLATVSVAPPGKRAMVPRAPVLSVQFLRN